MDGGGHDVAAVEHVFHHGPVQGSRIAACPLVFGGNLLVHRREQRARAAGKIGNAQFADGLGIRPVHASSFATASRAKSAADAGKV